MRFIIKQNNLLPIAMLEVAVMKTIYLRLFSISGLSISSVPGSIRKDNSNPSHIRLTRLRGEFLLSGVSV